MMKRHISQLLSRISFFVGLASLALWLFFFVIFLIGELNEVAPLTSVILYSVAGGVFSAAALGVLALVPAARNTHGLAALASVIISAVDFVFIIDTFGFLAALSVVFTTGILGGFQTIAALVAVILAALSFSGMRGTTVFDRLESHPTDGE